MDRLYCPQIYSLLYTDVASYNTLVHIFAQTNHTSAGVMYTGSSVASCDYDVSLIANDLSYHVGKFFYNILYFVGTGNNMQCKHFSLV